MRIATFLAAILAATPLAAQDAEEFARDNLLAIFYHEFGHALIDLLGLPIYGREEDAADNASVLLMEWLYEEETAAAMVISTADSFWAESWAEGDELPFWDVHGLSEQRYYNTLCVFYGGNPDGRQEMVDLMGLPEDRAVTCEEEYQSLDYSWGQVLEEISSPPDGGVGLTLEIRTPGAPLIEAVIAEEIAVMNEVFELPIEVPVVVEECGEANAFYDPETRSITMCVEFEPYLYDLFQSLSE